MKRRYIPVAVLVALAACSETPTEPMVSANLASPGFSHLPTHQVYVSDANVMTWDPILAASEDTNWPTTVCTNQPGVGLSANWQNPHNAYVLTGHPWANDYFIAPWINSRNTLSSVGPGGHNWTKYERTVSGNGSFVIRLLADNCSWIYLDGTLVGVQNTNLAANSYGLTLNGTHTLVFIIFDGGGAAGGKFILETTTTPPPPLNPDLDGDGHPNTSDAFPLDPTEWADSDGDGVGDNGDNCPAISNADQTDTDGDGIGDACDPTPTGDSDGDGVDNGTDNCPSVANADQADLDGDGLGDACDPDIDGDGVLNENDAYPNDPTRSSFDVDNDGVIDENDNCPAVSNASQADLDNDGVGDACDSDIDGDGVDNGSDAFPTNPAEWTDSDDDGVGNNADEFDNSDTGPALMVGACNPGVGNWRISGGTWANDLIAAAYASAPNHGAFVRAVTELSNGWKKAGLITGRQHGAIVSCAARTK